MCAVKHGIASIAPPPEVATDAQHAHLADVVFVDFYVFFEAVSALHVLRVKRGPLLSWDRRLPGAPPLPAGLSWIVFGRQSALPAAAAQLIAPPGPAQQGAQTN